MTESEKRQRILDATLALIAEHGFHGTAMSQITKRSGVSAGIIYHYFENKDDLIQQLYWNIKSKFFAQLMSNRPQDLPTPDSFFQLWTNAYRIFRAHPTEAMFLEQYDNSPYAQSWQLDLENEDVVALLQMIQTHIESGYLKPLPMPIIYKLTLGIAADVARWQHHGIIEMDDQLLQQISESCLQAVRR